ncbi:MULTISPECIES: Rieske (2Fe-2S) protein [Streptomyces]|uniref:Cytochrome bc1 complex Rieske iron-sulfur subunit n=1 Tax=Streptomyces xanthochromogenes TaxID=67384 RepID=A0ABQ3AII7_9ACTN|nr:Rieske (2Fe-2S) protein [Streptomyces xanthochromogenes]MYV95829.1 Rieske 2Fe-2S domain-containing protein [Streptomyces sp. SID1034]GGY49135.1 iron-sulfur protein [Streptomyces xanthochromogenes]
MDAVNSRRTVLVAAAGAAALAGCSNSGDSGGSSSPTPGAPSGSASATPGASSPPAASGESSPPAQAGQVLAKVSDIPVGGGKIFAEQKVVVTQPTAGTFKGFSAICTHQGCTVSTVADGTIDCPCHGSKYRIADASVANGPATRPLPARRITVDKDSILLP